MKKYLPLILFLLVLVLKAAAVSPANARFSVGVQVFGLSIHPHGVLQPELMPRKLDPKGIFVMNLGIVASFEYFLFEDIVSIKLAQAFYSDCGNLPGGFTHIGLRGRILAIGPHRLYGGIGPTWIYRRSWFRLEGYDPAGSFFHGGPGSDWQHRFIWYGGEFEYNWYFRESTALAINFVPGYPDLMSLYTGFRFRF